MVSFLRIAGYVLAIASVLCGIGRFMAAGNSSPFTDSQEALVWTTVFELTPVAIGLAGWLLGVAALVVLFRADRSDRRILLRSIAALALPGLVLIGVSRAIHGERRSEFAALAERAQPLIDAIEQYGLDHGRPPDSLRGLVPDYIPTVPKTGHARYATFEYELFGPADGALPTPGQSNEGASLRTPPSEGVTWELSVPCSLGPGNWDVFFYWPTEDYPDAVGTGPIERIGRWAYLDE